MAACFRVSLLLIITLCQILNVAVAQQSCTMGFPSTLSQCTAASDCDTGPSQAVTRIIPDMNFTCTGMVTHWRAAGVFNTMNSRVTDAMLGIWRETGVDSGIYERTGRIQLGKCGDEDQAPLVTGMSNVYDCTLPQSDRKSVQPGDVIGIEIAENGVYRFELYFTTGGGPRNYQFSDHVSMATLSQATSPGSKPIQNQPQISLTVEPTTAPVLPTIQPPNITEVTSMVQPATVPPTTTTEASTTAAATDTIIVTATTVTTTVNTESTVGSTTEIPPATNYTKTTQELPSTPMTDNTVTDSSTTMSENIMGDSTIAKVTPVTGQQNASNSIGTIAGAAVGGIIAVLLILIIALLLVLVLRRQTRNGQKFTPSNNATIVNPVYDDNIAIQVPNSDAGAVGVYSMVGAADIDHAPTDYEDIDDTKPTLAPADMFLNSINDYSKTPRPIEMSAYETPVQTLPKDFMPGSSFADVGVLYVPSQEQRNSLPKNGTNGDVYSAIGMRQYSECGAAPMLFEEDDTYWVPASDANELYKQLSAKKYREIVRKQIQITGHLGSGQFGTVNKGIWQSPMGAMDVAIKQLQPGASEEEKVKFLQEAAINGQFRHPNVVKLMGVVTVGEPTMIVLELLSNGDLHNYLLKLQPSPGEILPSNTQQLLLKFCQQVASGMDYLARKAFVHRDLAARNILVADDKTCKISDFGMSRDLMDENYYVSHGGKVPVKWTAPEAIHYKKYSSASDVWSYGCVMYEIWSLGHKPFEAYRNAEVIKMIDEGYRLPPPPGLSKELYKIMIQCWHPDRSSRPTFPQLVEMLSRAEFELFVWDEEDLSNSDPQVKLIGAPLEVTKDLYFELQRSYLSS